MANRSSPQKRPSPSSRPSCAPPNRLSSFTEPEMRRWPHPVDGIPPSSCSSTVDSQMNQLLAELHCSLSQQIQLLTEIRSLLEQLVLESSQDGTEK